MGPDGIPAELLRAGGPWVVSYLHEIIRGVVRSVGIPVDWKGSRLARLWKGKKDAKVCGNSRGLMLGSHSGKVFTGLLKDAIFDTYRLAMPDEQCGCVKAKSTAHVCHTSRLFLDWCHGTGRSSCVRFLDLEKAFDTVVREFVFWGPTQQQGVPTVGDRCPWCWN